ncbi:MAG: hypothetical protein DLM68_11410 [Hyphomicrobiales bacterium]|nr:MAG: hypothetical protein DLM68_11410 [Hyphomicrobiales bacterium]
MELSEIDRQNFAIFSVAASRNSPPKLHFFRAIPLIPKRGRYGPCKVFGPNRTKMFHVKHFGTIAHAFRTKRPARATFHDAAPP